MMRVHVTNVPVEEQVVLHILCVYVCVFFYINIYLQHVPLHGNTTCSSVHVIHCLFFWSVIGTTIRDL